MVEKIKIFITLIILTTTNSASALIWFHGVAGGVVGSSKATVNSDVPSNPYEYDSSKGGYDAVARAGLNFFALHFGAVGSYAKEEYKGTRLGPVENRGDNSDYQFSLERKLAGGHIAYRVPKSGVYLYAEYYPYLEAKTLGVDNPDNNFLSVGDTLSGNGFGFGVYAHYMGIFVVNLMIRGLNYNKLTYSTGNEQSIPGGDFRDRISSTEFAIHIGLGI